MMDSSNPWIRRECFGTLCGSKLSPSRGAPRWTPVRPRCAPSSPSHRCDDCSHRGRSDRPWRIRGVQSSPRPTRSAAQCASPRPAARPGHQRHTLFACSLDQLPCGPHIQAPGTSRFVPSGFRGRRVVVRHDDPLPVEADASACRITIPGTKIRTVPCGKGRGRRESAATSWSPGGSRRPMSAIRSSG